MSKIIYMIVGSLIETVLYSCAMGSKSPDFDDFPLRSNEYSVFNKCKDGDIVNACKYECTKYKRDNTCKDGHETTKRINIVNSIKNGYVLIDKSFFINLIRKIN